MQRLTIALLLAATMLPAQATSITARILKVQTESIGDAFNVVYPDTDIVDSPCERTNTENRMTLTSNVQHAAALLALMPGKIVTIGGTGNCNASGFETVFLIMLCADQ